LVSMWKIFPFFSFSPSSSSPPPSSAASSPTVVGKSAWGTGRMGRERDHPRVPCPTPQGPQPPPP
jgi:hypothetical protein